MKISGPRVAMLFSSSKLEADRSARVMEARGICAGRRREPRAASTCARQGRRHSAFPRVSAVLEATGSLAQRQWLQLPESVAPCIRLGSYGWLALRSNVTHMVLSGMSVAVPVFRLAPS